MTGSRAVLSAALDRAAATIGANAAAFGPLFPDDCAIDGVYRPRPPGAGQPTGGNHGWTTGFRTGLLWLAFQRAAQPDLRRAAQRDVASFSRRIDQRIDTDTHDLGFLYSLSCVTAWQLTGDAAARRAGLRAADALLERVIEPAGVIQAWGDLSDPGQRGRTIIDSLMNTPLLWWASAVSGRPHYAAAAWRHVAQLRDHIIRPDNTTFHTFWWRTDDGRPLGGTTQQGFSDASCWARGQAWGIYGFTLNHVLSGDPSFLRAARRCADHYLDRLPADGVPYWDLVFADGCDQPRDTSAAAIAACGLAELAARVGPGDEGRRYRRAAEATAVALARHHTPVPGRANALLLHGVYDWPKGVGVDQANLWGDYFYSEALTRLTAPGWTPYWLLGPGATPAASPADTGRPVRQPVPGGDL